MHLRGRLIRASCRLCGFTACCGRQTRQAIRRGAFTSVSDLITATPTFIDAYNQRLRTVPLDQNRRPDPQRSQPSKELRYTKLKGNHVLDETAVFGDLVVQPPGRVVVLLCIPVQPITPLLASPRLGGPD